jgi:transcriptional regulator with XRE-family HTH domain
MIMLITPDQIRAARALLRMDQEELARRANVSVVTVRRLEAPDGLSKVAPGTFGEVQRALEAAGAEFVERGVRHRAFTPEEIEARYQRIRAIAERSAARFKDAPPFTEDDLYDEDGLPA